MGLSRNNYFRVHKNAEYSKSAVGLHIIKLFHKDNNWPRTLAVYCLTSNRNTTEQGRFGYHSLFQSFWRRVSLINNDIMKAFLFLREIKYIITQTPDQWSGEAVNFCHLSNTTKNVSFPSRVSLRNISRLRHARLFSVSNQHTRLENSFGGWIVKRKNQERSKRRQLTITWVRNSQDLQGMVYRETRYCTPVELFTQARHIL